MNPHLTALHLLRARFGDVEGTLPSPDVSGFMSLLNFAGEHGASAALSAGLRQLISDNPGWAGIAQILDEVESRNAEANVRFATAAARIAAAFGDAGIPCVFLKGAATLLDSEAGAPWRQLTDLDVLVPENRITDAVKALQREGYHASDYQTGFEQRLHHHYPALIDETEGIAVELHIRLMQDEGQDPVPPAEIFGCAETVQREGQSFQIPCPTHRMIHLVAHAQISNWGYALRRLSLRDILEARELAFRYAIDWPLVARRFERMGAGRELYGFLRAAEALLGLPCPGAGRGSEQGAAWSSQAIDLMVAAEPSWKTALRIVMNYASTLIRNPRRLRILWATLTSRPRRQDFIRVTRSRLGLGH